MGEKGLLEALIPHLPGLKPVEKREGGLRQKLVLAFVDGDLADILILGGIPAPEKPEGPQPRTETARAGLEEFREHLGDDLRVELPAP